MARHETNQPLEADPQYHYTVESCQVIDGDTVDVMIWGETHRIRLHGIDAPEMDQPYGVEAAQMLANLTQPEYQLYATVTRQFDAYGRAVAILHYGHTDDSVNARLVYAGLAYASRYETDYRQLEHSARQSRAGVWQQRHGGQKPWEHRRGQQRRKNDNNFLQGCGFGCAIVIALILILLMIGMCAAVTVTE